MADRAALERRIAEILRYKDPQATDEDPLHFWQGSDIGYGPDAPALIQARSNLFRDQQMSLPGVRHIPDGPIAGTQKSYGPGMFNLADMMGTFGPVSINWRNRPESTNIEDRRSQPLIEKAALISGAPHVRTTPQGGLGLMSGKESTMADVSDIYSGILKPGGGIFEPGPPVMLPPQGTDKGAAITRALIASSMDDPGLGPSGGGGDAWGNFQGFRDDTPYDVRSMAQIGGNPGPTRVAQAPSTVDATDPLNIDHLGLTRDPFRPPASPAEQAITAALLSPAGLVAAGPALGGDMQWSPAETAPAPSGDTWLGMREPGQTGALVARPGMVTGNRPIVGFAAPSRGDVVDQIGAAHKRGLLSEGATAALLAGRGGYTVHKSQNGVLGENALMPTRTISGAIRNSYGD